MLAKNPDEPVSSSLTMSVTQLVYSNAAVEMLLVSPTASSSFSSTCLWRQGCWANACSRKSDQRKRGRNTPGTDTVDL